VAVDGNDMAMVAAESRFLNPKPKTFSCPALNPAREKTEMTTVVAGGDGSNGDGGGCRWLAVDR